MEFLSFGLVRSCLRVMADLGAQENTCAYIFSQGFNKKLPIFQSLIKYLLKFRARQSGRTCGGVSFTAVETAGASGHRHEMDLAFWEHGARVEDGLAAGDAE
jgi:hypothetical protein